MGNSPSSDQGTRGARLDVTRDDSPVEVALGLLALVLRVEMFGFMLPIEHTNDNSEEGRDDRYVLSTGARVSIFISPLTVVYV